MIFLLISGEAGEAVREGVGDEEVHEGWRMALRVQLVQNHG